MNVHSIAMQQALDKIKLLREEIGAAGTNQKRPSLEPLDSSKVAPHEKPFFDLMKSAVDSVNNQQQISKDLQVAFARGDDVSLTDVAISMQKASVSFEATVQVRNKILESYKEIMNMSV